MSDSASAPSAPAASSAPQTSTPATAAEATPSTSPAGSQTEASSASSAATTPKAETKPAAPAPPPKKFKLKVDGRDEEYAESDLVKLAQMGRAADKRFQEAAAARKQAEEFIKLLKSDPKAVLMNPAIGVDVRKFAEEYLVNEFKREQLSPEQKALQEREARIKELEDRERQREEARQTEERQRLEAHFAQEYDRKMTDVLSKSGLPKTPMTVKRMAEYLSLGLNNGLELEPADVVGLVRQDYLNEVQSLFSQTEGDALLQILGDGIANKIRKSDLARIQKLKAGAQQPQVTEEAPAAPQKPAMPKQPDAGPQKIGIHEWREMMEKKKQGWK